jgi:hypothetical protein
VEASRYCASLDGHCPCRPVHRISIGRSAAAASPRNRCRDGKDPGTTTLRGNTHGYLHATVSNWRSATLLARWRTLICCVIPPLGFRQPSPPSDSPNRPMWKPSIRLVEYSAQRYSFFTGARSQLRFLRNCVASAFPSVCREPPYDRLCCRSWKPLAHWMIPPVSWISITHRQSTH